MDTRYPPTEVAIDEGLVRRLLESQAPELAGRTVRRVAEGWDNVTYRLGRELAVRLPRRAAAVHLLGHEQRWLPELSAGLSLEVPRLVHAGRPDHGYPWPWSVVAWVEGEPADRTPLAAEEAPRLARELRVLHRPAGAAFPYNPFRGVPLRERAETVDGRLDRLEAAGASWAPALRRIWDDAMTAPPATDRVWLHGDVHPGNVVVRQGRLAGLIDWGDLTAGDAASDLVCAWLLFRDPAARADFLDAYGATDAQRLRVRGWAVNFATGILDSEDPRHEATARAVVEALTAPDGPGPGTP